MRFLPSGADLSSMVVERKRSELENSLSWPWICWSWSWPSVWWDRLPTTQWWGSSSVSPPVTSALFLLIYRRCSVQSLASDLQAPSHREQGRLPENATYEPGKNSCLLFSVGNHCGISQFQSSDGSSSLCWVLMWGNAEFISGGGKWKLVGAFSWNDFGQHVAVEWTPVGF